MKFYQVITCIDNRGRVISNLTASEEFDECPQSEFRSNRRCDIYVDWFATREEAKEFVKSAKEA